MHVLGLAIAWEALFVFDVMVLVLTWASVYRTRSLNQNRPRNLASIIVRDGEPVLFARDCTAHNEAITQEQCISCMLHIRGEDAAY